jgi:hypothetical protein
MSGIGLMKPTLVKQVRLQGCHAKTVMQGSDFILLSLPPFAKSRCHP